eukprot:CAMPEP_0197031258 /NCGR_PEP_ID=MMETSP1384-20130603/10321_1 /TAXON_ID=29189 /ORGANISM="Ammonia sp." /LENGTH=159 /DNA_ID=CAMNT_0042460765 /DNA_START=37 /DNA_END=516 /DNA_ORIENTATION=+
MDDYNSDEEPLTANEYRSPYDMSGVDEPSSKERNRQINDKMGLVQDEIENVKAEVHQSIVRVVERGDKLEDINAKAEELQVQAGIFKKNARQTRTHFCLQKWKMIACIVFILFVLGLSLGLWSLNIGDDPQDVTHDGAAQQRAIDGSDIGHKHLNEKAV